MRTLTALAGILFPQAFAYARQVLQQGDPKRAAMGISSRRTLFSVAWVAGPPVAALVLADWGFTYTYGLAYGLNLALCVLGLALILFARPRPRITPDVPETELLHGRV